MFPLTKFSDRRDVPTRWYVGCFLCYFVVICIKQLNLCTQQVNRMNRIYLYLLFSVPNKYLFICPDRWTRANLNTPFSKGIKILMDVHANDTLPYAHTLYCYCYNYVELSQAGSTRISFMTYIALFEITLLLPANIIQLNQSYNMLYKKYFGHKNNKNTIKSISVISLSTS